MKTNTGFTVFLAYRCGGSCSTAPFNMKLVLVKVDLYPNFDLPKIYHGCGVRKKSNRFNELTDRGNNERCSSLTHVMFWKFHDTKKHKVSHKRYLAHGFLKELTEKGSLISYKSILHLDEQKRNR